MRNRAAVVEGATYAWGKKSITIIHYLYTQLRAVKAPPVWSVHKYL